MSQNNPLLKINLPGLKREIKPMGIGTWAWGDNFFWGFRKNKTGPEDIKNAFTASYDSGVILFDTAEVYGLGKSEKFLGKFIADTNGNLVIASKFMPFPWRLSKRAFNRALKKSLGRLGISTLDLYQIHWPLQIRSIEYWVDAMAEAHQKGLIKGIGVSNFNKELTQLAYERLKKYNLPLVSNQIEYNLITRGAEFSGLLELCEELNVKVIAYSPLAQGLLTGKYTQNNPPQGIRGKRFNQATLSKIELLTQFQSRIGEKYGGKTPAQVALNWTICKGTIPIPGAKNQHQAETNLGALGWQLSEDDIHQLDKESTRLFRNI